MPFLQPSIEGAPPPESDPWDWTVDQVVYALTETDSPLMDSNRTLCLPDLHRLASVLRDQDVNGLALLTLVKDKILRDEWGMKSMSHRASILHLARVLQDQSQKYEKHIVASGRVSSLGGSSRFSTPYVMSPQQHIPRAASRAVGLLKAPLDFGGVLQTTAGIDEVVSIPNIEAVETANIMAKAPVLPSCPMPDMQLSTGPQLNQDPPTSIIDGDVEDRSDERVSRTPSKRQGETIVVDATGKKRRKLILAQPEGFGPAYVQKAAPILPKEDPVLPTAPTETPDAIKFAEASSVTMLKQPLLGDREAVIDIHESASASQDQEPQSTVQVSVPGPGTIRIDEQGRKRLRPISLSQPQFNTGTPSSLVPAFGENPRQRAYGRRMKRTPDQLYLGIDSLSVDQVFYGDTGFEKEIEHNCVFDSTIQQDPESDFENFKILAQDTCSNGQRLYINKRMKHFLLSPRLILERDGIEHVGVITYPERLGKKHYPLSITIFSKSYNGITVSRSNRSKWMRDHKAPSPTDPNTGSFNVADPVLAQDENKDSEWAALEKWKYLDGQDEVLPLYGDSGSEGEYELDTWREIEQERGTMTRPLRQSKHQQLTNEEVNETINHAMEQLIQDWSLKRLPKLKEKAWRFWVKSRRDGNASLQIRVLTFETEKLDGRINNLRKEIAGEIWSKTSQVAKQCKIMQPSLFDREDNKWRIALLRSSRVPAKPLLLPNHSKTARLPRSPKEVKQDGEDVETDKESSESSDDSLNDFVVEDEVELDNNEAVLGDDDLSMPDPDDDAKSNDLASHAEESSGHAIQGAKDGRLGPGEQDISEPDSFLGRLNDESIFLEHGTLLSLDHQDRETSHNQNDMSNFIDLTQQSEPGESIEPPVKPEVDYAIRTPPLFDSENDSDIFRRSRGKKPPVFRKPESAFERSKVIDLDTDSTEVEAEVASIALPAYTNVDAIRAMDPLELVRQQDRKRLLIWMIAHTPTLRRQGSFDYLRHSSFDQTYQDAVVSLKGLRGHKKLFRDTDPETSESIVQIAVWYVCWTVPVKADRSGLIVSHVLATLEDQEGYGPFYVFLLECIKFYSEAQDPSEEILPPRKRENIVREDSDDLNDFDDSEDSHIYPMRKRKYHVQESQATLDKRRAARDRLQADEGRRRREELKDRFAGVQKEEIDSLGVVVNPGKLEDHDFIYLNPRFGNGARLRPHQTEGLQFLWREITADNEDLQGCLLAQTMGLGKTMQIIALMVALSEASRSPNPNIYQQVPHALRESRTLVLCPPALVENWWDEFILWVPQSSSENIGKVRKVSSSLELTERLDQIYTWSKEGGVIIIGFEAFKSLVNNNPRLAAKGGARKAPLDESEHSRVKEALLGSANLVIADEAHFIKASSSAINLAINQIRTKSRIALTGSPLNNNLGEYYTLIDWIAPNYLGTRVEFKATYEEPIREGLYRDSTQSQKRTSMKKLKALELEMGPKVHRAGLSVLQNNLIKGKSEFVVVVALTDLQQKAYTIYVRNMQMASRENEPHLATLWTWLGVLQLLCNHPKLYWKKLQEPKVSKKKSKSNQLEEGILPSEEDATLLNEATSQVALSQVIEESKDIFEDLTLPLEALCLSNKMQVLMKILDFAEAARDKVLVFSHRIATLDYIEDQLAKASKKYARLDGTLDTNKRQQISKDFNMGKVNICLISTRAGGTGLNFHGANRVVIMDENFNPTWEQQAIGRAYRIGQQKPVYVYRLQAAGTFEAIIQNQGLFKEQLATRVVDKKNPTRSATKGTGAYLFEPKPVLQDDLKGSIGKDPLVLDQLLTDQTNHILSITPSEIFHIEDNENLTAEEREEAEQMQKDEQLRRRDPAKYFAMIERRKHAVIHKVQQATRLPTTPGSQKASVTSTQPTGRHNKVNGPDSPLQPSPVASSSQLAMEDTASSSNTPSRDTCAGNMPPPAAPDPHANPTSRVERSISTPASTLHMIYTSDVATPSGAHTRSSSAGPSHWTAFYSPLAPERLDKELLDRQLLVPDPSPTASGDGDAAILDALNNEVVTLFRHTPFNQSPNERGDMSARIQDIAKEDFYAAMSAKGLRNPTLALADAARKLYAQELSHIIFEMSSDEAEYRRLVAGVKQLLARDEVKPKHLVKVMMEKHNSVTGPSVMSSLVDVSKGIQTTMADAWKVQANGKARKNEHWTEPVGRILSHLASSSSPETSPATGKAAQKALDFVTPEHTQKSSNNKRKVNGETIEPKDGLMQGQRQDDGRQAKKAKGATAIGPNFKNPSGHTEQQFQDLLQKETNRASL